MTTFGEQFYAKNITCEKINGAAPGGGDGGHLPAVHSASTTNLGFFAASSGVLIQAGGTDVTNSLGTAGTGTTLPQLSATPTAAEISQALFALFTQQKALKDALKAYGLLS